MKENTLLRKICVLADAKLKFKDERFLLGTAWINDMPIDITIKPFGVVLNSVGSFSGDAVKMSKCEWRGKGVFRRLIPHIKQALLESGFTPELYLTPLSPVWERDYNLVETEKYGYKIVL
jgi:hypothetical protein